MYKHTVPGYPGPLMRQSSSTHPGPPMRQNSSGPPMRQNSSTYRSILLHRGESIDPLEESITSFGRRRYTSNSKDDVLLSSITPAYLGGEASLFSAPSQESLNGKEEVDVSNSSLGYILPWVQPHSLGYGLGYSLNSLGTAP